MVANNAIDFPIRILEKYNKLSTNIHRSHSLRQAMRNDKNYRILVDLHLSNKNGQRESSETMEKESKKVRRRKKTTSNGNPT